MAQPRIDRVELRLDHPAIGVVAEALAPAVKPYGRARGAAVIGISALLAAGWKLEPPSDEEAEAIAAADAAVAQDIEEFRP